MRTAIYIRVSTKMQEDRYSLSAQHTELTSYALNQGWKIISEFKDVESGGKLDKKGLTALLDMAEDGLLDVVLCIDQDRLSRLDTIAWEYLKATLRDNGVKIAEPGRITDLSNEDEEFISDIKNLIAKREKKSIVRRMMRGKRQRMREGKGWGKAPLGYLYNKTEEKYELDEKWAWVIPLIDNLYLEKQLGMMAISDELNKISLTPSGTHWNETLVHRRLISKAFHGVMEKTFSNGETISIEDMYPKLRTEETWQQIQEERTKRGSQYKVTSRVKHDLHILRRTSFLCGECGRKINLEMHGTKKSPRYYLKHGRRIRIKDQSVCDIAINTVRFEHHIIRAIKEILSSEEHAKKYIDLEYDDEKLVLLEKQHKENQKRIASLNGKIDNLLDLFLDGLFNKETLIQKQTEIQTELDRMNTETQELHAKLILIRSSQNNYDSIYELFEAAEGFETELMPLERAQLFGKIFPKGILYRERLDLQFKLNGAPINVELPIDSDPFPWHRSKKQK
ncbi:recombinase family protein [Domibacillus tundrae]|uniref:recombinase family protein n=1 Tax=Domibacillus tundrae TaxID=1587527 RepID=UPI00061819FA|nr:recombinase family protein [Domibacillus tundrae]